MLENWFTVISQWCKRLVYSRSVSVFVMLGFVRLSVPAIASICRFWNILFPFRCGIGWAVGYRIRDFCCFARSGQLGGSVSCLAIPLAPEILRRPLAHAHVFGLGLVYFVRATCHVALESLLFGIPLSRTTVPFISAY